MRQVQVYIEGHKLELFEDEQIQVNSSVQNINDISKVFTDFSQSFTVPASTINNAIFKHFYQSDIGDPATPSTLFDHNIRRNALIEIDLTTFRRGKIQIEKANIKNNHPENYQITFYGEIRTLKDAFGEDKLTQLDLSNLEFTYTAANIYNRITDLTTNYDVRFPLIASNRLWAYQSSGEDVTNNSHAIKFNELFPATKVSKIFEAIEAQYGLTFQGTFLSDPRFTNVFLYSKNAIVNEFITAPTDLDFLSKTNYNDVNWSSFSTQNAEDFVDLATNTVNVQDFNPNVFEHVIQIEILSLSSANTIYIDVFQDGNYYQTFTTSIPNVFNVVIQNTSGLNTNITYQLRSVVAINVDIVVYYQVFAFYSLNNITNSLCVIQTGTTTITSFINLANYMPDMKVSDFFAGVLKEFNMTCIGLEKDVFEILPLDEWYQQGAIVDITPYTDIDSIDIERIKLFKKIGFKYQQSESFVNRKYNQITNSEYGNTEYQFAYDGDEYNIEVPFENLLFTRAEKTSDPTQYAIFGYNLNENYQGYVPKPTLLYLYGESNDLSAHPIMFYNGAGHDNITSFAQFGQDLTYQNTKYSLNFGAENSVIHLETIQQGLYAEYYFSYLVNLFNLKNRLTHVKTNLPISLLTSLQLNDRLIIRDKRYIINEMKSNLTTGEVNFSLYLDFRPMTPSRKPIVISKDPQTVGVAVNLVNKAYKADITTTSAGVTISPSTITQSQFIDVTVGANADSVQYLLAENGDFLITEDYQNLITENSTVKAITLDIQNTLTDGSTVDQIIQILQQ